MKKETIFPEGVSVLSLFDGMSCGLISFIDLDIPVKSYTCYEIDEYAIKTSTHNFPRADHRGDVFRADFTEFRGVDFLVGGSPCTWWSIAQHNGREKHASGKGWELFCQYTRAIREARPRFFIYENNRSMSDEIRDCIREELGFSEICINSALVSAQNRQRYYWVGKRNKDGTYSRVVVRQPKDRGILLKDILDSGMTWKKKQQTIDSNYYKGGNMTSPKRQSGQRNAVAEMIRVGSLPNSDGKQTDAQSKRVYSIEGKSTNQQAGGGGQGANTGLYAIPCCLRMERSEEEKKCRKDYESGRVHHGFKELKEYQPRPDGKTNTVTTRVVVDNPIMENAAEIIDCDRFGTPTLARSKTNGKIYEVYQVSGGKIDIYGRKYKIRLPDGVYIIRKLTVPECMRLQTVPEWFDFSCVSNKQAYTMLGNGWTCAVIEHLIRACWIGKTYKERIYKQYELF